MPTDALRSLARTGHRLRRSLIGPHGLAFLSGVMLAGYWFGGAGLLLFAGLAIPGGVALASVLAGQGLISSGKDGLTGLPLRRQGLAALADAMEQAPRHGRATMCLAIEIDDFDSYARNHDASVADEVMLRVADRLQSTLRDSDVLAVIDRATFVAIPVAMRRADIETALQIAARMQAAVSDPIAVGAARIYASVSIGFALPGQFSAPSATSLLDAAEAGLAEARMQGPGSIRAYAPGERRPRIISSKLVEEVAEALENGQIQAWYQPQLSTDTGAVMGFEALARWNHPAHGLIAPAEFLPAVAAAGRMQRLGQVILFQSLTALRDWQREGFVVPSVAVNLSEEDLRDPRLPERVRWELDRFDLPPDRLCIEVLENVTVSGDDDMVVRNVAVLAEMGVSIDLDDFGTGTASIAAIRRFAVHRIKIDRSFVRRIDLDRGQQDMVAAILSMAERLNLATLAEGVETLGEHAMLAQLGCNAVQGFGIAPPMPYPDTLDWMRKHSEKLADTPRLGRKAG